MVHTKAPLLLLLLLLLLPSICLSVHGSSPMGAPCVAVHQRRSTVVVAAEVNGTVATTPPPAAPRHRNFEHRQSFACRTQRFTLSAAGAMVADGERLAKRLEQWWRGKIATVRDLMGTKAVVAVSSSCRQANDTEKKKKKRQSCKLYRNPTWNRSLMNAIEWEKKHEKREWSTWQRCCERWRRCPSARLGAL